MDSCLGVVRNDLKVEVDLGALKMKYRTSPEPEMEALIQDPNLTHFTKTH